MEAKTPGKEKVPFPNSRKSNRNRRMGSHRGGTIFGGTIL